MIDSNDLWQRVETVTARERGRGLKTVSTACEVFEEGGVPYQLRVLLEAHPKTRAKEEQKKTRRNPFLPPDADLYIGDLSPTHGAVLNKFNVFGGHLLVITRQYVSQEGLLDLDDFEALARAMQGVDSLGFYNAGRLAGASQPHRHLQVAPLPMMPSVKGLPTPIDAAITADRPLPFRHSMVPLEGLPGDRFHAVHLLDLFRSLMSEQGLEKGDDPYNLLLTNRWMMVVPRHSDRFEGVSINALGFAGSLLVRDRERLDRVKTIGPGAILRAVTGETET